MATLDIAIVAAIVFAYAAVSEGLRRWFVTAPMVFVAVGLAVGPSGLGVVDLEIGDPAVRGVAEITLVLILFSDAARIDVRRLRAEHRLPVRLLAAGLPLTIVAGTAAALLVLPHLGLYEAALLAAVLAPTDAALAQAVVTESRVPVRIRQALNVESGLNDGLVLPALTVFVVAAGGELAGTSGPVVGVVLQQLGVAVVVGAAGGYLGGRLIDRAARREWMSANLEQLAALAVPLAIFGITVRLGGSGFVAAFTAGLTFGLVARERCKRLYEFTEQEGHLLVMLTFLLFGGALLDRAMVGLDPATAGYALLSLTVVRMVPVALSLLRTGLRVDSVLFLGWFGPRGLASVVFALLIVAESGLGAAEEILQVVAWTVLLSVVAHGASARPAARRYAARLHRRRGTRAEGSEHAAAPELPVRT